MNQAELIINTNGTIYHLALKPDEVANTIITVGDQDRVAEVSKYFDEVLIKRQSREFVTHTGTLNGKRLTVISTGIGTDNIDIVLNELHALKNIDFTTLKRKENHQALEIVRIGTSGAVQPEIELGSTLVSGLAIGLDGLLHFYDAPEKMDLHNVYNEELSVLQHLPKPYFAYASAGLLATFKAHFPQVGCTITAPGFYAPQGRNVNHPPKIKDFIGSLKAQKLGSLLITNIEMETAGIYGLAEILGHQAISISALLANRCNGAFAQHPKELVDALIQKVLHIIAP